MIQASAPGKMIILGEYAVLYGAPALVHTVDKRAEVNVHPLSGNEFLVSSPSLRVDPQPFVLTKSGSVRFNPHLHTVIRNRLLFFKKIFEQILSALKIDNPGTGLSIELKTDAFYSQQFRSKLGFGSSAALTVALANAMARAYNVTVDAKSLFRIALDAHRAAQGNLGSGIDIAASAYGGILNYTMAAHSEKQEAPKKVSSWEALPMAVVWSGSSASTSKMVKSVAQLETDNPSLHRMLIDTLTKISIDGAQAYAEQYLDGFMYSVNAFYSALQKLGEESSTSIISAAHARLAELAFQESCVYKPSGAGGGDIGLLFAASKDKLETVSKKVEQNGYKIVDVKLDPKGVYIQEEIK